MRAMTFIRPMDWALIRAPEAVRKNVENRKGVPPEGSKGRWLCVHSGKKWKEEYRHSAHRSVRTLIFDEKGNTRPGMAAKLDGQVPSIPTKEEWPHHGRIIGLVQLDGYGFLSTSGPKPFPVGHEPYISSPWRMDDQNWWFIAARFDLPVPVPAQGMLGLWRVPQPAYGAVLEQLPPHIAGALL